MKPSQGRWPLQVFRVTSLVVPSALAWDATFSAPHPTRLTEAITAPAASQARAAPDSVSTSIWSSTEGRARPSCAWRRRRSSASTPRKRRPAAISSHSGASR